MLPSTIQQQDLPGLTQTNAEVLCTLLEDRNRGYVVAGRNGQPFSEETLPKDLKTRGIWLLIDAGAFVLEMDNKTLAETWLRNDSEPEAAVYFDSNHRPVVVYRNKPDSTKPLIATPCVNDLSRCVVYLDEAHTRGVDLKFPPSAIGALTLALGQTKDHTVQAAMRLRQLATTQSVIFYAPPNVHQSLTDLCHPSGPVDSGHVVWWLMEQTCRWTTDLSGLYFAQGAGFVRRTDLYLKYHDPAASVADQKGVMGKLRTKEFQTLEEMYVQPAKVAVPKTEPGTALDGQLQMLLRRKKGMLEAGGGGMAGAFEEVEQERELEVQVEEVREVQAPPPRTALVYPGLHSDIVRFLSTGESGEESKFPSLWTLLGGTIAGRKHGLKAVESRVYVSTEFTRTVRLAAYEEKTDDDLLRPVEWILWSATAAVGIVVIPEEAEDILARMWFGDKNGRADGVYLIPYSSPVTRSMHMFGLLRYYAVPAVPTDYEFPAWLAIEIGILAGRMFFAHHEVAGMTQYLNSTRIGKRKLMGFMFEWAAMRRQAKNVDHTPLGQLCLGREMTPSMPFFQ